MTRLQEVRQQLEANISATSHGDGNSIWISTWACMVILAQEIERIEATLGSSSGEMVDE